MAENDTSTHTVRQFSAGEIDCLADRIFRTGLECRRDDLMAASALLRRLACDGDVSELYVWNLNGEAL